MGYGFCLENNPFEQYAVKLLDQPNVMYLRDSTFKGTRYTDQPRYLEGIPPTLSDHFIQRNSSIVGTNLMSSDKTTDRRRVSTAHILRKTFLQKLFQLRQISKTMKLSSEPGRDQKQRNIQIYRQSQESVLDNVCNELKAYIQTFIWRGMDTD